MAFAAINAIIAHVLDREVWRYSAETYQEPIGAIATGIAVPLPSLPQSALALLNRPAPFDDATLTCWSRLPRPCQDYGDRYP